MKRLFTQFSFPGGIPSHVAPETPGLDPRGRRARLRAVARLRRRLRQSRPDRRLRGRRRRGGDRAARDQLALEQVPEPADATAPCCRSCTSTATRSPTRPCSPASATRSSSSLFRGYGYTPHFVEGDDPQVMHEAMAATLDARLRPRSRRSSAARGPRRRRRAPALADDRPAHPQGLDLPEGDRRQAHRGLLALAPGADGRDARTTPSTSRILEDWMKSYRPEELFDAAGRLRPELAALAPAGTRRMGANPHANGGAAAARPAPAGLPRLRGRRARARRGGRRGDAGHGRASCAT